MKPMFFIIITLIAFNNLFAFNTDTTATKSADSTIVLAGDSVNVRDILAKEIAEVKERQKQEELKLQTLVVSQSNEQKLSSNNIIEYLLLALEGAIVLVLVFLWFKTKNYRKKAKLKKLKFNISKLREEKIICGLTNDLTKVRKKLLTIPIAFNDGGKDVIRKARQFEISKGEVYLAAKIKLLSGDQK